jgi:hypothetical protein
MSKLKIGQPPVESNIFQASSPEWKGLEGRHPVRRWGRPQMDIQGQEPPREEFLPYPLTSKNKTPRPDTTQFMHQAQKRIF